MVEQGIYFALGCIVTALCALMFAPVFWRRALRLTRRRLQLQVPLSMREILAERDQLRAEFAVERLRIEQALERVEAGKAADMAEIGRRSMEAASLGSALTALRQVAATQALDIVSLGREVAESGAVNGGLQQAIADAFAQIDRWRDRAYAGAAEADELRDDLESHRTTIAGLKTRAMGLEMRLTDSERAAENRLKAAEHGLRSRLEVAMGQATRHETSAIALRRECDEAKARIRALEGELEALRHDEQALQLQASLQGDGLRNRLDIAMGQATRHEAIAIALRRESDEAKARIRALEGELETLRSGEEALRLQASQQGDGLRSRLDIAMGQATRHETIVLALRRESDEATARIRALEGELETLRSGDEALQRQASLQGDGLRRRLDIAMGQASRHETSAIALRRECDEATARVRALEGELETLRGREQALQLQASLMGVVKERRPPPAEPEPVRVAGEAEEELRASIHALGLAVAMMTRRAATPPAEPPALARARDDRPSRIEAN